MQNMQEKLKIGIPEEKRKAVVEGLSRLLAATFTLYLKTHSFHWNVTGPQFASLHLVFEGQYNELWLALDPIAERIRSLGHFAPGRIQELSQLSGIRDTDGVPPAMEMVRHLVEGHEAVARTARDLFPAMDSSADEGSKELVTARLQAHEKMAWMLRSTLET